MHTSVFETKKVRLEENFRAAEAIFQEGEDLTIRHLILLLYGRGGCSLLHLFLIVKCNITKFFFCFIDIVMIRRGVERTPMLIETHH